ncbi:hypothetical protein Lser_V15G29315 [Lactuca serriola]
MMEMIREASANLGIFQVVNHGIQVSVIDEVVQGFCRFHEQDDEVKKGFYTRDLSSTLVFNSSYDLYSSLALNWRGIIFSFMALLLMGFGHKNILCAHTNPNAWI